MLFFVLSANTTVLLVPGLHVEGEVNSPDVLLYCVYIYILYLILKANSFPSILQVTNGTSISFFRPIGGPPQTHIAPFADNDSEVLKWATETFGGVTSFTTARDPMDTTFTGMKGKITLCIGEVASYDACIISDLVICKTLNSFRCTATINLYPAAGNTSR